MLTIPENLLQNCMQYSVSITSKPFYQRGTLTNIYGKVHNYLLIGNDKNTSLSISQGSCPDQ